MSREVTLQCLLSLMGEFHSSYVDRCLNIGEMIDASMANSWRKKSF